MTKFCVLAACLLSFGTYQTLADTCDTFAGNVIKNCGFETGDLTSWAASPLSQVGNWTGADKTDALQGRYGAYLASPYSFDYGINVYASLSQTPTLTQGQQYLLSYTLAHDTSSNPTATSDNAFFVVFRNSVLLNSVVLDADGFGPTVFNVAFTNATPGSAFLGFEASDVNFYFSLDNVSLVPIPEPGNFAIAGAAALVIAGLVSRRRVRIRSLN